jgi:hypothetical protein
VSIHGKSLYILTPMYGGNLSVNYHHSFFQLMHAFEELKRKGLDVDLSAHNIYNESLIPRARNRLVDCFLKESAFTHACFIDADIGFEPLDIISMLEMDKDILGVPCSKKSIRWDRIQIALARRVLEWTRNNPACQNGFDPVALAQQFRESQAALPAEAFPRIGGDFVLNFPLDEMQKTITFDTPEPMRHVGTGLLMVKREVFMKFMKCYPDRWYESRSDSASNPGRIHDFFRVGINPETREYDSEDYWFCRDVIAMGYKVLIAPWVRTTHMGTYTFVGDMPAALASAGSIF